MCNKAIYVSMGLKFNLKIAGYTLNCQYMLEL